jgi:hypothetical protein
VHALDAYVLLGLSEPFLGGKLYLSANSRKANRKQK